MSASDLVPHVVLFVTGLERENAELKSQLKEQKSQLKEREDKQLLVQITGPNRTPIYYEGSMKNGHNDISGIQWYLNIRKKKNGVVLPFSLSLTDLEFWSGGIFIKNFQDVERLYGHHFTPDDSGSGTGIGFISFIVGKESRRERGPDYDITACIGPMTSADYNKLTDEQLDLKERIPLYDHVRWRIGTIRFRKDKIPGIMSLLEKLGIPNDETPVTV